MNRRITMMQVELRINGADDRRAVADRTFLAHFLREELDIERTHVGCDTIERGTRTVEPNGAAGKDRS
jgi:carbon-monoxide dehydrogenase small subunit